MDGELVDGEEGGATVAKYIMLAEAVGHGVFGNLKMLGLADNAISGAEQHAVAVAVVPDAERLGAAERRLAFARALFPDELAATRI